MTRSTVQPLHRQIVQFNFLPSLELHPDHRDTIVDPRVWEALSASPVGHKQLSAAILARDRLQDDWVTAFQTRERRVALLGWQALERLLMLTGVALNAAWVATRISGSDVAAIKTALGPELYGFAVGRARFLGDVAAWPEPRDSGAVLSWVKRAGLRYLEGCTHQQPRAVAARLKLRLPRLVAAEQDGVEAALPLPEPARATALFRKLAPEVGEPCISLLA